jgi:hypothetical protein
MSGEQSFFIIKASSTQLPYGSLSESPEGASMDKTFVQISRNIALRARIVSNIHWKGGKKE